MLFHLGQALLIILVGCSALSCSPEDIKTNTGIPDLSSPEKAIAVFVQAFQTGNDGLLNTVATQNALPEFNPMQRVDCPTPSLIGFEIQRRRVTQDEGQYANASQRGDVELYVKLKWDETRELEPNCKAENLLWSKGVYLLRNTDGDWRIMSCAPFWPDESEKHLEN